MTLHVWTARLSYGGPDRLDITRATADKDPGAPGRFWAPSWKLVRMARYGLGHAQELRAAGEREQADRIAAQTWARYQDEYRDEMLRSYREFRSEWERLLARDQITLVCFCTTRQCHRFLLAEYLVRLGAVYEGESPAEEQRGKVG